MQAQRFFNSMRWRDIDLLYGAARFFYQLGTGLLLWSVVLGDIVDLLEKRGRIWGAEISGTCGMVLCWVGLVMLLAGLYLGRILRKGRRCVNCGMLVMQKEMECKCCGQDAKEAKPLYVKGILRL